MTFKITTRTPTSLIAYEHIIEGDDILQALTDFLTKDNNKPINIINIERI